LNTTPIATPNDTIYLAALKKLQQQGIGLTQEGQTLTADTFVAAVAAQQNPSVVLPGGVALPVRDLTDLAVLTTVYAAGAPALASHPGLARALGAMHTAGTTFKAVDTQAANYDGDWSTPPVEVGPYGAFLALTDKDRLHRLEVIEPGTAPGKASPEPFRPEGTEELVAHHVFDMGGDAANLSHPVTGANLQQLEKNGNVLYNKEKEWDEKSAEQLYLGIHKEDVHNIVVAIDKKSNTKIKELSVAELDTNPHVADEFKERADRYKRLEAARGSSGYSSDTKDALEALDAEVPGHPMAEREAAMTQLVGLERDYSWKVRDDFKAVVDQARDGETLDQTAAQYADIVKRYGKSKSSDNRKDAVAAFGAYRALDKALPAGLPLADKQKKFLDLVGKTQNANATQRGFELLYGDGQSANYGQREQWLDGLLAAEKKFAPSRGHGAVEVFDILTRTAQPGEDLSEDVGYYNELAEAHPTWGHDQSHEAMRLLREELPLKNPTDLSRSEKERRFVDMLKKSDESVKDVWDTWSALAHGGTTAEFDTRQQILDRIVASRHCTQGAAGRDLKKLDDETRSQGGLGGALAARLLKLLDVSPSFEAARNAFDQIERAALPSAVADREAIYLTVAGVRHRAIVAARVRDAKSDPMKYEPDEKQIDASMQDYWYVVRNAMAQPNVPPAAIATDYARYLKAAHADSNEARTAHAIARTRLQDGGPLSVTPAQRQEWLARSLRATESAEAAYDLLTWAEKSANAEQAGDRIGGLEHLMPLARHFNSDDAFKDSMTLLEPLLAKNRGSGTIGGVAQRLASLFVEVASPEDPNAEKVYDMKLSRYTRRGRSAEEVLGTLRQTFLENGSTLAEVQSDLEDFASFMKSSGKEWKCVEAWPEIRSSLPGVANTDKVAVLTRLLPNLKSYDDSDWMELYRAITAHGPDAAQLKENSEVMALLLTEHKSEEAIKLYDAIHRGVSGSLGTTPGQADNARVRRWAELAAKGGSSSGLEDAFETMRVPVGAEDVAEREKALSELIDLQNLLQAQSPLSEAVKDFHALADTLMPGESLTATVSLYSELANAVRKGETARKVITALQRDRLAGHFGKESLRDLITRFATSFAVNGDVSKSMESLHNQNRDNTVKQDDDTVVVGGIKIPKKKPAK
jgi:hypothetical protein